jgi:Cupin domain
LANLIYTAPFAGRTNESWLWGTLGFKGALIAMPIVDTYGLKVVERHPGWKGRYFHSASMTFAHYDFDKGASIHEHFHPEEEVYEVIEGEVEITIDGTTQIARAGSCGNSSHERPPLRQSVDRWAHDCGGSPSATRIWLIGKY